MDVCGQALGGPTSLRARAAEEVDAGSESEVASPHLKGTIDGPSQRACGKLRPHMSQFCQSSPPLLGGRPDSGSQGVAGLSHGRARSCGWASPARAVPRASTGVRLGVCVVCARVSVGDAGYLSECVCMLGGACLCAPACVCSACVSCLCVSQSGCVFVCVCLGVRSRALCMLQGQCIVRRASIHRPRTLADWAECRDILLDELQAFYKQAPYNSLWLVRTLLVCDGLPQHLCLIVA